MVVSLSQHHPLTEQLCCRLVAADEIQITHQFVPEAEIHQMQYRMLDTADIVIDRQPVIRPLIQHALCVRCAVAGVIPARLHERIKGVGLPFCVLTAFRAARLAPLGIGLDRRLHAHEGHVLGQHHGQIFIRHRHCPAVWTVNHRHRATPVALAGNTPVPQAVIHFALADSAVFDMLGNSVERGFEIQSAEVAGINGDGRFLGRPGRLGNINGITLCRSHHLNDGQAVTGGEGMVTFIVCRHCHDRSRAVTHQHKVRDPHGNVLSA